MSDEYTFSPSGIYYAPPDGEYDEYVTYIQQLPSNQKPEVFGLHANANITKDELEASRLLQATMSTQGSQSGGSGGDAGKGVVKSVAENILSKITGPFDTAAVSAKYPIMYEESMNTVLTQELIRYNRLIKVRLTHEPGCVREDLLVWLWELDMQEAMCVGLQVWLAISCSSKTAFAGHSALVPVLDTCCFNCDAYDFSDTSFAPCSAEVTI